MSEISSLRLNVDGALALCFTLAGLAASVASAALGI